MTRIAVLPPELASQIAAGEVVERPASVVKELVENALDAEATRVDVEMDGGGIARIAVHDDGAGMSEADARLSVERHATSKLTSVEQLHALGTFGFRGEALPTIASVSVLRVITRARDAEEAVEVLVSGGAPSVVRPAGRKVGTTVEVCELFANVPARRKFLKSSATESGHVTDVLEQLALSRPDVTFTLTRDGRRVREFLRTADRGTRAAMLLDDETLVGCAGKRGPITVEAWLGRPETARPGTAGLRLVVNGRSVRDRALATAVAQAYGSVLERGRYPRGILYVDLPGELVDVNVHPQKLEVRFVDARAVGDAVYGVLARELAGALSMPMAGRGDWSRRTPAAPPVMPVPSVPAPTSSEAALDEAFVPTPPAARSEWTEGLQLLNRNSDATGAESFGSNQLGPPSLEAMAEAVRRTQPPEWGPDVGGSGWPPPSELGASDATNATRDAGSSLRPTYQRGGAEAPTQPSQTSLFPRAFGASEPSTLAVRERPTSANEEPRWASLTFVAQVRRTYLICENDDGLFLIDQHAAAERLNFTKLRRTYLDRTLAAQALLFPLSLDFTASELDTAESEATQLQSLGFELRRRGPTTASLHTVPKLLVRASPERLVRDLLSELNRVDGRAFSDAVDHALATLACHGSVRAGDRLAPEEARALLVGLDGAEMAAFCPHGRPIVSFTPWTELERKVGRR